MFALCPDVLYQIGLVRRAGESITHIQQRRHHMTAQGISCLVYFINDSLVLRSLRDIPSSFFSQTPYFKCLRSLYIFALLLLI